MRALTSTLTIIVIASTSACAGMFANQETGEEIEPFEPRRVAWSFTIEESPQLAEPQDQTEPDRLVKALIAFYAIVNNQDEERDTRETRRACAKAWSKLAREARVNKALAPGLTSAQGYLGVECGPAYAQKSISVLTRYTRRHKQADPGFYEARFWLAEAYLEISRTSKALTQYRYILGELETPLYPLALLRTAHCHWDDGEAEQARTNMQYVMDWIGDRTEPRWVRSLKRQVIEDMAGFAE